MGEPTSSSRTSASSSLVPWNDSPTTSGNGCSMSMSSVAPAPRSVSSAAPPHGAATAGVHDVVIGARTGEPSGRVPGEQVRGVGTRRDIAARARGRRDRGVGRLSVRDAVAASRDQHRRTAGAPERAIGEADDFEAMLASNPDMASDPMMPDVAARRIATALLAGEPYIVTHGDVVAAVDARAAALLRAAGPHATVDVWFRETVDDDSDCHRSRERMGRACIERLRGLADVLVAADLKAPDIDGAIGVACDVSDPEAVAALATRVARPRSVPSARALGRHLADDGRRPPRAPGRPRGHRVAAGRLRRARGARVGGGVLLVFGCVPDRPVRHRGPGAADQRSVGAGLPRPCRLVRWQRQWLRVRAGQGRRDPRQSDARRSDGAGEVAA